ncbi:MAG: hypothetical protein EOO04_22205 [Chitinophagaceae bacterium]|nr:MAG: hypothetical protein EOO04_22205 [Chitinophagaceae bacterium]
MEWHIITMITSYSIIPAFIAALFKYQAVKERYLPFLFLLGVGLLNEIISTLLISIGEQTLLNSRIYILLEMFLLLCQFAWWGLFKRRKAILYLISSVLVIIWFIESRSTEPIHSFLPVFRIITAFVLIVLSLRYIFSLMVYKEAPLKQEASFLIAIGSCCYFLPVLITEIFISEMSALSDAFKGTLFRTIGLFNIITNLIYLRAVLWITPKSFFISAS